jgi:demethylmenaquinone methyltransferase/2-methoxy-6-polyprenyl-1,4-benzoquinol methylase
MRTIEEEERSYYAVVQEAFEKLAPFYDLMTLPAMRLRSRVVGFAGASAGSSVLDVATGTGSQAVAFARRGYNVTAIDLSEAMLGVAHKKAGSGLVRFEAGDATRLRFGTDSFDVVTTSFALHDMPPSIRERVLQEMVRVARPGGAILIVDYSLPVNVIGRFLVYGLIQLYEGPYYEGFIRSELRVVLAATGVAVTGEQAALLGAARIWRGRKG